MAGNKFIPLLVPASCVALCNAALSSDLPADRPWRTRRPACEPYTYIGNPGRSECRLSDAQRGCRQPVPWMCRGRSGQCSRGFYPFGRRFSTRTRRAGPAELCGATGPFQSYPSAYHGRPFISKVQLVDNLNGKCVSLPPWRFAVLFSGCHIRNQLRVHFTLCRHRDLDSGRVCIKRCLVFLLQQSVVW